MIYTQLDLARPSGQLPASVFRCKKCHRGLRALWVVSVQSYYLICDHQGGCDVATQAPASWEDWIHDTLTQQRTTGALQLCR